jgi:translation elongation factor EF-Tu-like GTPase
MEPFSFTDLMDRGPAIEVLARVSMLRTEDGGRTKPFTAPYRPNHNFGSSEGAEFYVGQVEVPPGVQVQPGETRELAIKFLNGPGLPQLLRVGRTWRIQEGSRLVATAEVIAVQTAVTHHDRDA